MKKPIYLYLIYTLCNMLSVDAQTKLPQNSILKQVNTFKLKGFTYVVYTKDINKKLSETKPTKKKPDIEDIPSFNDKTGEEYIIYHTNAKGQKKKSIEEYCPKLVKDNRQKIKEESKYEIKDGTLIITGCVYDYHFTSIKVVLVYKPDKFGNLILDKSTQDNINTDSLSDDYVKHQYATAPVPPEDKKPIEE
jgi:hypothetical protein